MDEIKTFTRSILMRDKTTQEITATRYEMAKYLLEHKKERMICDDDEELFNRYCRVQEYEYNKTHPKPKGKLGGKREGAGRKPKAGGTFRHGFRFSKKVHDILMEHSDNTTAYVEKAILFYEGREDE